MAKVLRMAIKMEELIDAIKRMNKEEREEFIENLLAATSPEYLASIAEARADYLSERVQSHKDVFGK
jgi:hypothetical protein